MFGVYSVKILFNKKTYKGIANFGVRPTFGSSSPILEVNVFEKNLNFYNKDIKVLFVEFIRKEKKFKNVIISFFISLQNWYILFTYTSKKIFF